MWPKSVIILLGQAIGGPALDARNSATLTIGETDAERHREVVQPD
jgi:hypothetical protein